MTLDQNSEMLQFEGGSNERSEIFLFESIDREPQSYITYPKINLADQLGREI